MEQARVRHAYKAMEHNAISSVITPDAVLTLVLNNVIAKKNKKKTDYHEAHQKPKSFSSGFFNRKKASAARVKDFSTKATDHTKKSYKKLGRSLLIWQAASLGIFMGVHIFRYFQKRKAGKGIKD